MEMGSSEEPNRSQALDGAPVMSTRNIHVQLQLRYRHNACVPVSRLPAELLSQVFNLSINSNYGYCGERLAGLKRRNDISHVCHHWRTVSISTSSLWSDIDIDSKVSYELVQELLLRSKQVPLQIHIHFRWDSPSHSPSSQRVLARIFKELQRVEKLQLKVPLIEFAILPWPQESTPSLKRLELYRISGFPYNLGPEHSQFTNNFGARFPMLVHLTARHLIFSFRRWTLPSTLTCLYIEDEAMRPECDLIDILRAFRHLPLLEELALVHAVPSTVHLTPGVSLDPVPLHHLRSLALCGRLGSCTQVLDCLAYPTSTKLNLQFEMSPNNYHTYPSLSKYIPRDVRWSTVVFGFTEPRNPGIQGPKPGDAASCVFAFRAWQDVKPECVALLAEHADFHLSFLDPGNHISFDDLSPLHSFLSGLPSLAQVTSLSHHSADDEEDHGRTAFHPSGMYIQMQAVETFYIYGVMDKLLLLLQGSGDLYFPKLRELHASCIGFTNVQSTFKDLLRKRQQEHPIGRLVLHSCYDLSASYVDELMEIIDVERRSLWI